MKGLLRPLHLLLETRDGGDTVGAEKSTPSLFSSDGANGKWTRTGPGRSKLGVGGRSWAKKG